MEKEIMGFWEIIYFGILLSFILPLSLSFVFWILKPVVLLDTTGYSMIAIVLVTSLIDAYLGLKLFEKILEPRLEKRRKKKKTHFP